jgi:hypothetical protein
MKRGSDPPRLRELLRDGSDPLGRALEDMREEGPSAEELRRVTLGVRMALGVPPAGSGGPNGGSGAAGSGAAGSSSAAPVGTAVGALKGSAAGAKLISSFFVPMAAGVLTAGAVLVTVTTVTSRKIAAPPPVDVVPPAAQAPPSPAPLRASLETAPAASAAAVMSGSQHATETPLATPVFRRPGQWNTVAPAPPPSGEKQMAPLPGNEATQPPTELALVNEAQEALAARDPARALAQAREHELRFRDGMLAQEREVIAIDALLRLGRRREAESRALRFHAQYPQSAHGRRVDVLLQTSSP